MALDTSHKDSAVKDDSGVRILWQYRRTFILIFPVEAVARGRTYGWECEHSMSFLEESLMTLVQNRCPRCCHSRWHDPFEIGRDVSLKTKR